MTGKLNFDGKVIAVYGPMVRINFEIPKAAERRRSRDTRPAQQCSCEFCRKQHTENQSEQEPTPLSASVSGLST